MSCETSTPGKDVFVSAAGPFGSFVMALVGILIKNSVMIYVNLSLFLLNLVPALPLDGGRIVKVLLLKENGISKTEKITKICSVTCSAAVLLVGITLKSVWLVSVAGVIFFESRGSMNVTEGIIKCKKHFPVKQIEITGSLKPYKIIKHISPYYRLSVKNGNEIKSEEEIMGIRQN